MLGSFGSFVSCGGGVAQWSTKIPLQNGPIRHPAGSISRSAQATPGSSAISCGSPAQAAGGTANGLISADTATTDGMRIYRNNAPFNLSITTNSPGADTVVWSIADDSLLYSAT